jgi:ABC-type glycerol-3-phosphate transport system substrate-binding protein
MRRIALMSVVLAALAGCGGEQELKLAPGAKPPVKPLMAAKAPTTEEMLTPPPIAEPQRVTEIIKKSEERKEDRYDLPPPG